MARKYLWGIVSSLLSFSFGLEVCQGALGSSQEGAPCPTNTNTSSQSMASPTLDGSAEQQEFIDPPFGQVKELVQTPPVKGRASAFNWLLMPSVGQSTFEHWMKGAHPDFSLSAGNSDPNELIEMVGEHEKLGPNGRLCGICCRRITMNGDSLQDRTIRMLLTARPPKVLVYEINCSCRLNNPGAVRAFVKNGGYLVVTGRDIRGVQEAFPGLITITSGSLAHDELVDAKLLRPDQILGTNLATDARWYIPAGFAPIKVLNPQTVRVLCTSRQLAEDIPDGQGVLATIFPYGRGYVLCLAGTLDNNTGSVNSDSGVTKQLKHEELPDPAPKIHVSLRHGLAANFIEAGLTHKRIPIGTRTPSTQSPLAK